MPLIGGNVGVIGESHGNICSILKPMEPVFRGIIDKAGEINFRNDIRNGVADLNLIIIVLYREQTAQGIVCEINTGSHVPCNAQFVIKFHNRSRDNALKCAHAWQLPEHRVIVAVFRNINPEVIVRGNGNGDFLFRVNSLVYVCSGTRRCEGTEVYNDHGAGNACASGADQCKL